MRSTSDLTASFGRQAYVGTVGIKHACCRDGLSASLQVLTFFFSAPPSSRPLAQSLSVKTGRIG